MDYSGIRLSRSIVSDGGVEMLDEGWICQNFLSATRTEVVDFRKIDFNGRIYMMKIIALERLNKRKTARKTNKMTQVERRIDHYFDQRKDFDFFQNEMDNEKVVLADRKWNLE